MMIRKFFALFIAVAAVGTGCQSSQKADQSADEKAAVTPTKLFYRISAADNAATDSVKLSFTVVNLTGKEQRFCKWETPFEPFLGKYFDVKNEAGEEAAFKGAMARRVMPPPAEAYITVPSNDSVSTSINLADKYTLAKGTYKISYTGSGVSGLDSGNVITVKVAAP